MRCPGMRRRAGVRCHNGAMLSDFFNSLVTWVGQHPVAAGLVIIGGVVAILKCIGEGSDRTWCDCEEKADQP